MPKHFHPNYFSNPSHTHSHTSFQKTHHYHPSVDYSSATIDPISHPTTQDYSSSVAAIVAGSILVFSALMLPMHSIIAVAFVLAIAVLGGFLIGKGILGMMNANQDQQSDSYQPSMS